MKSQDMIVLKDGDTINIASRQFVYHGDFSHIGQKSVRRVPSLDLRCPLRCAFLLPKGKYFDAHLQEQKEHK